ncbi:MAG: crossover junction endodeoxyribonuclease RuvC, partial [Opitutales bacterium]|nr:crossover junction endodeoxyribonuclease RuvC [Opitutales bacterium]
IALVYSQTLKIPAKENLLSCTGKIHQGVAEILNKYQPDVCAAEQTIYVQNFQTAQIMGIARGAILSAVALAGKPLYEYAPLRIKQAVCGYGRASKEQVSRMVQGILKTPLKVGFDETDAAAAALCCLWNIGTSVS